MLPEGTATEDLAMTELGICCLGAPSPATVLLVTGKTFHNSLYTVLIWPSAECCHLYLGLSEGPLCPLAHLFLSCSWFQEDAVMKH